MRTTGIPRNGRKLYWTPQHRTEVSRHAFVTEKIGPVRRHLDMQTKVADRKRVEQRSTGGDIRVEFQDSIMVGAQLQLTR